MARGSSGTTKCGFCMTEHHEQCKAEIKYYEKTWYCTCEKCHPERGKVNEVVEETVSEVSEQEEA